jgi:heme oxygenase
LEREKKSVMGSLAKRLGQLSRMSLETESANILKTGKANKVPGSLALALDGTLKSGHDMQAFGLGTLASMSSLERYQRFTQSMFHVYSAMEEELDKTDTPALELWKKHGEALRRSEALYFDLKDVLSADQFDQAMKAPFSGPTLNYVNAIRTAGERDRAEQGGSLIGHLYCRYFADLFGGQMLSIPYNLALSLPPNTPRHYQFDLIASRREFIETVYEDINVSGRLLLSKEQHDETSVVNEALLAFQHNIHVYKEEPVVWDSAKGAFNICVGFGNRYLMMSPTRK